MNKIMKLGAMVLLALSIISCGKEENENKKEIIYKSVEVIPANREEINIVATFSGTLNAIKSVDEMTDGPGTVVKINYKNGDMVKKGDVIIELEDQSTESQYLDSKAKYASAKSDYLTKKSTYEKYKTLYNEKLISQEEYNKVKNGYLASKGMYESSLANLKNSNKIHSDLKMKAKFDGKLANLEFERYQKIKKETRVFSIVDDRELKVYGGIDSKNMIGIKEGAIAKIEVENSNKIIEGELYEVNPVSDPQTRKFGVKIKMGNKEHAYRQGMFAKVELQTGKKEGILVPKKALIVEELSNYIFIVKKESIELGEGETKEKKEVLIAYKVKVELGSSSGENQEVISEKLETKNTVIVAGQYSLSDGDYVKESK
ncbi:MAG: efflux RND transporter periplasmic adaptor subunit [Psychrilyobacter sp.]|nr:efflux RND transporter periplasmic adaptor subunit [Psychrilyobacter sp.]